MRIISGLFKGRRINPPQNKWKTRPTTDRAKESLFNILQNRLDFEGLRVADLFAGTGGMGYEFLSRGAEKVTFVEKFKPCTAFIKKTIQEFDLSDKAEILQMDVFKFLEQERSVSYDVIFADPPYALFKMQEIPVILSAKTLLKSGGLLIIEHDHRQNFENHLNFAEHRQYGQSFFSFFVF